MTVLAVLHGIKWHQSTVTKVESGDRPVRLAEALAVASILHVSLADLIDDPDSPGAARRRSERLKGRIEELARINWDTRMRAEKLSKLLTDEEESSSGEHPEAP